MAKTTSLSSKALILTLSLLLCSVSFAQNSNSSNRVVKEDPSALAMTTDLVLVRPVMFTVTAVGSVLWLISAPFAAAGGNLKQTGNTLVLKPAMNTFVRCLGCTQAGYSHDVPERSE
jgi:hypothetical protein